MEYRGRYPESRMVVDVLKSVHNTTTIINYAADYNELNSFLSTFDIWGSRGHFKMSEDKNHQEVWFEATKEFYSISQTDTMRRVFKKFGVKIRHVISGGAGGGSIEE